MILSLRNAAGNKFLHHLHLGLDKFSFVLTAFLIVAMIGSPLLRIQLPYCPNRPKNQIKHVLERRFRKVGQHRTVTL